MESWDEEESWRRKKNPGEGGREELFIPEGGRGKGKRAFLIGVGIASFPNRGFYRTAASQGSTTRESSGIANKNHKQGMTASCRYGPRWIKLAWRREQTFT